MKLSKTTKKCVAIIIFALIAIVILIGLVRVILPIIFIFNSERIVTAMLDNAYIDASYDGWKNVELSGADTIFLPSQWTVVHTNSDLHIYDGNTAVAAGYRTNNASNAHQDEQLIRSAIGFEPISKKNIYTNPILLDWNDACVCSYNVVGPNDENAFVYFLELPSYVFAFASDNENQDLLSIIEAIAFSFNKK